MTLALDHAESCAALADWRSPCSCGVGIETISIPIIKVSAEYISIPKLLFALNLVPSVSEARRLISQNAVEIVDGDDRHTAALKEWLPKKFKLRCGREWREVSFQ
jgi:tyrosyl-tRNA synthetase